MRAVPGRTPAKNAGRVCAVCKAPCRLYADYCDRCAKKDELSITQTHNVMRRAKILER